MPTPNGYSYTAPTPAPPTTPVVVPTATGNPPAPGIPSPLLTNGGVVGGSTVAMIAILLGFIFNLQRTVTKSEISATGALFILVLFIEESL